MQTLDDLSFLEGEAAEVAPLLLGCILERTIHNQTKIRVRIVETEAYDQTDIASHSYKGKTSRTEVMFGSAGHLYVYFTYGMHYCCNIVVGSVGYGAAVLIRAVEPIDGRDAMAARRPGKNGSELSNGPAKLCQALAIDMQLNGHDLRYDPLRLVRQERLPLHKIIQTTRIGLRHAKETPWRFYVAGNSYVSRP